MVMMLDSLSRPRFGRHSAGGSRCCCSPPLVRDSNTRSSANRSHLISESVREMPGAADCSDDCQDVDVYVYSLMYMLTASLSKPPPALRKEVCVVFGSLLIDWLIYDVVCFSSNATFQQYSKPSCQIESNTFLKSSDDKIKYCRTHTLTHTQTHTVAIMETQFPWQQLCRIPIEHSHTTVCVSVAGVGRGLTLLQHWCFSIVLQIFGRWMWRSCAEGLKLKHHRVCVRLCVSMCWNMC